MLQEEGSGWRVAWDPSRKDFPILIGGQDWAFELTELEWKCFVQLVLDLLEEHNQIKSQLMEEESISIELERDFCWGCLEGDKSKWSLHVLFQSKKTCFRDIEVSWPSSNAKDFVNGMRTMWESFQ